ncbi:hypothetical protein TeGR_g6969 [Tetraparma gracilis]|uniref:Sidoreflexin n=1 Tax=Tetraparma gracilis TaxID=2962635 RepID=A0ABQ6MU92_9STRA|nr:hypothetical protein TeGR_g6969 [Tetraparma gracilis]
MSTPPFTLDGSRFDQSTFAGRFLGFMHMIDPSLLLVSTEQLEDDRALIDRFKKNPVTNATDMTDEALWASRKRLDGVIHPTFQEEIHPFFRMAAFIPVNLPIVAGMLATSSVQGQLFWQWANQTYNSGLNYANRAGGDVDTTEIATNYGLAVGTACGLAAALKRFATTGPPLIRRLGAKPWAIPYLSVAAAGSANIYFSRRSELTQGVQVCREDGTAVGVSQEAAKQGLIQTIASRGVALPLPLLVFPPLLVSGMSRLPGLGSPRLKAPLELAAVTVALCGAVPAAIALFPQKLELDPKSLEPRFQNVVDPATNKPVTSLFANKGL